MNILKNKEIYRDFCSRDDQIPLFSQPWWLDCTAGVGNWNVALVEEGGRVVASMPYVLRKRFGFTALTQPALTQTLGPWLRESNGKYSSRLSLQKDRLQALFSQLPTFDHFSQAWHYSRTNWLPAFWMGYKQTTRYTYQLPNLGDEELLWGGLQQSIRTDIKKAESRFDVQVRKDLNVDDFLALNRLVFERQGRHLPYSEEYVRAIDAACSSRNARQIFIAEDSKGRRHAGVYLIWDCNSAYYLMGGGDPALRNSGATSLCMWEAIKFASAVTKQFDFEGSMIESVERYFRAFGAIQTPYFAISKTPSRLLKTAIFLKTLKSGS